MASSFGITHRLYALSAVLTLAMAGLGGYTYVALEDIQDIAEQSEAVRMRQVDAMAKSELNLTRASLQLRHAMLARTPAERQAALDDVKHLRQQMDEALAGYEKRMFTAGAKERFEQLKPQLATFWATGQKNIGFIEAGQVPEAFAFLVEHTIPARNQVLKAMDDSVAYQREALRGDIDRIRADARMLLLSLAGLLAAAAAGLVGLSWHVARTLSRRVQACSEVAERVRAGDLLTPVHDAARDEFSPLFKALGEMQANLAGVVGAVRSNADSVATASAQIAQGNQDLSGRTEEQASALQQTAATMGQLGGAIRSNNDSAQQANQLAQGATGAAGRGSQVVGQVVDTMKTIHDSSRRIADIIGVIDGIAFQTNILALNAAVEAARAGEQGRGFAVVAAEVRTLAQRSAEAAREIKALISSSVQQVEHGSTLVGQAGKAMQEIMAAIQRVNDIVAEISAASAEQSTGVSQVEQAVSQMDQATQQNAALVEQSAAAAESLKAQAQQLVAAVGAFRTAEAAARAPAPAPVARQKPLPPKPAAAQVAAPSLPLRAPAPALPPAPAPALATATAAAATSNTNDEWESF